MYTFKTIYPPTLVGDSLLQATLSSGEWYVDNNQLSEELSFAQRSCSGHHSSGGDVRSGSSGSSGGETVSPALPAGTPKLVPIKSFRNELVNMSVRPHSDFVFNSLALFILYSCCHCFISYWHHFIILFADICPCIFLADQWTMYCETS